MDIVPGNRYNCSTAGGNGLDDADLYVRWNQEAEIAAFLYDCFSASVDSNEFCSLLAPAEASSLWATVDAYESVCIRIFLAFCMVA